MKFHGGFSVVQVPVKSLCDLVSLLPTLFSTDEFLLGAPHSALWHHIGRARFYFLREKIIVRSKFVFQLLRVSIYKHNDDCKYNITHESFNTSFSITLVM